MLGVLDRWTRTVNTCILQTLIAQTKIFHNQFQQQNGAGLDRGSLIASQTHIPQSRTICMNCSADTMVLRSN